MILLAEHDQCTGCMACRQICPTQCIDEKEDFLGNLYPQINMVKCVECGKCISACPELQKDKLKFHSIKQANAVWSKDPNSRRTSASGGAAAEFYKYALENGYWICGVQYVEGFHVVHTISNEMSNIAKYKQSKYVYSEVGTIYREVREKLKAQEKILFISLPCKVAGLKQYLGKEYSALVTVDIVCHGTPSYRQLREHINQTGISASSLTFRNENEFVFQLKSDEDEILYNKKGRQDEYLAAFLEGLNYRDSCYHCTYARSDRISDITIADFWGLGAEISWNHPYSGAVSEVLIHTEQGKEFFEKCRNLFFTEERPISEAVNGNAQLNAPTLMHPKRKKFEEIYKTDGFESAVKATLSETMKQDKILQRKREFRKKLRSMAGIVIPRYRS